jgi:hypothetical protein
MESTTMAIVFIIGKAAIWLVIPLLFGIYEMTKHRKDMAREARGEASSSTIPGWLQAKPREAARPAPAEPAPQGDPEPLPVAANASTREEREAA